jgi:hypothetical protein
MYMISKGATPLPLNFLSIVLCKWKKKRHFDDTIAFYFDVVLFFILMLLLLCIVMQTFLVFLIFIGLNTEFLSSMFVVCNFHVRLLTMVVVVIFCVARTHARNFVYLANLHNFVIVVRYVISNAS